MCGHMMIDHMIFMQSEKKVIGEYVVMVGGREVVLTAVSTVYSAAMDIVPPVQHFRKSSISQLLVGLET